MDLVFYGMTLHHAWERERDQHIDQGQRLTAVRDRAEQALSQAKSRGALRGRWQSINGKLTLGWTWVEQHQEREPGISEQAA